MREDAQHFDLGSLGKHVEWVMDELNIPPPEPHSGAVWASAINLMYCSISLNELTPERMRAYGPLSDEAAHKLDGIRAELDGLVAGVSKPLGKSAAPLDGAEYQRTAQRIHGVR